MFLSRTATFHCAWRSGAKFDSALPVHAGSIKAVEKGSPALTPFRVSCLEFRVQLEVSSFSFQVSSFAEPGTRDQEPGTNNSRLASEPF